jgi:hypothetical protein
MGGFVYLFDLRDIMLRPVVLNNLYEVPLYLIIEH